MTEEQFSQSPGQTLRATMEAKGWAQQELAYALGRTPAYLNQI